MCESRAFSKILKAFSKADIYCILLQTFRGFRSTACHKHYY